MWNPGYTKRQFSGNQTGEKCQMAGPEMGNQTIILHSFTHLGEEKADPADARILIDRVQTRLENAEYETVQTPYGYFNDLSIQARGIRWRGSIKNFSRVKNSNVKAHTP
jgi:hypothetical protein